MRVCSLLLLCFFIPVCAGQTAPSPTIDFKKQIQPIFESRCYECHGPKKQKSGFRLDRKANALRGGDSGKPALVPGKPSDSLLVQKISSHDPDEVMPAKGDPLSPAQIALIRGWIEHGAT
jgi:mono/diheme cytochrome c family protein